MWVLPPPEPVLDPYNNSLVMPLHEWIEHPIAEELLHNGATLQVGGVLPPLLLAGKGDGRAQ